MNSAAYLARKFQAWAARSGIPLQGSKGERGAPNYTQSLGKNFFGGALLDSVRHAFGAGAGGELRGAIPKMSALHSSSAMAVNLFQYWVANEELDTLAKLLKIPSPKISTGKFEDRFPVCLNPPAHGLKEPPHLDFAFRYADGSRIGIECKLNEPYGRLDHKRLGSAYLTLPNAWDAIPHCRALAARLTEGTSDFHRLDASQLVKHLLGLTFQAPAAQVRLVYLYYDAIGAEAHEHRQEIQRFQSAIEGDPVRFAPMSTQEFILRAVQQVRAEHTAYVDYLASRYL